MDVRRLEILRELQLRGSVTAVAAATHRTPSAVSQQLKALQREAGTPLTYRYGRGLRLTPAGEALAASATEVAVAIERADALWQAYLGTPAGEVSFATFPTGGQMFLPRLLDAVAAAPGLTLAATDVDPRYGDFVSLTNDFDVVLGHSVGPNPDWDTPDLAVIPLVDEPLDVAMAADHPLASRPSVSADDVAREPWIGVPVGYPFERVLAEIERVSGVSARVIQRFSDIRVIEALVSSGHGLAIMPRFTGGATGSGVVLKPLEGITPSRRIAALLRAEVAERPSWGVILGALRVIAADLAD